MTEQLYQQALTYLQATLHWAPSFVNWESLAQIIWIGLTIFIARFADKKVRQKIATYLEQNPISNRWLLKPIIVARRSAFPLTMIILLFIYMVIADAVAASVTIVNLLEKLAVAWFLIGIVTSFIRSRKLFRFATATLWFVAALQIIGVLDAAILQLDRFRYSVGDTSISLLGVIKGLLAIAFFMYLANTLSRAGERVIRQTDDLTPSVKVLLIKLLKIGLYTIAALMGLNVIGIDLTTLTVFSGAAGLGLGFGLQKVFSNYISGIILLLDRSIKPGDVIGIDETDSYGWVQSLGSRYVSIITRDGKEHLVPNELLITEKVENWSHTDNNVRLKVPVGIAYHSDVKKAMTLIREAVEEEPRVLKTPTPNILMMGFGDSSVDIEARCWIRDPVNGIEPVRSAIYLRIWEKFQEHKIDIPFPQRDLHIKSLSPEALQQLKGAV